MRLFAFLVLLVINSTSYAKTTNYPIKLGETTINIQKITKEQGKAFVHLHQDENTALMAAKKYIAKYGGSIVTLNHKGTRNIVFKIHNEEYEFDPNRIYTDNGIKNTLKTHGNYSLKAHAAVQSFAQKITSLLPKNKIIAVHNNNGYSLHDYLPGHSFAQDAESLNICKKCFYRNFFLVTQKKDYYRLVNKNFNGILQAKNAVDDGSLSIYLSDKNYISVEAGYNQLQEQFKMLKNI